MSLAKHLWLHALVYLLVVPVTSSLKVLWSITHRLSLMIPFYCYGNNYDVRLRHKMTKNGGDRDHLEEKGSRYTWNRVILSHIKILILKRLENQLSHAHSWPFTTPWKHEISIISFHWCLLTVQPCMINPACMSIYLTFRANILLMNTHYRTLKKFNDLYLFRAPHFRSCLLIGRVLNRKFMLLNMHLTTKNISPETIELDGKMRYQYRHAWCVNFGSDSPSTQLHYSSS